MNKYLVALASGGLMEHPGIEYSEQEVIEANSQEEAAKIYNEKNKCSYFCGSVVAELVNGKVNVINDNIKVSWLKMLEEEL